MKEQSFAKKGCNTPPKTQMAFSEILTVGFVAHREDDSKKGCANKVQDVKYGCRCTKGCGITSHGCYITAFFFKCVAVFYCFRQRGHDSVDITKNLPMQMLIFALKTEFGLFTLAYPQRRLPADRSVRYTDALHVRAPI